MQANRVCSPHTVPRRNVPSAARLKLCGSVTIQTHRWLLGACRPRDGPRELKPRMQNSGGEEDSVPRSPPPRVRHRTRRHGSLLAPQAGSAATWGPAEH